MSEAVVRSGPAGKHQVILDGEVVGEHDTNAAAWRHVDRLNNEPLNKAQAISDWVFGQQVGRGDLYRFKSK